MELADYRQLVATLEPLARRDPDAMRRRVYGHIALGYGFVLTVLVALVGLTIALVAVIVSTGRVAALWKLVVALVVLVGIVLRALWVRIEPPPGRPLSRAEAPRLHERIEAIRTALQAPRPSTVLLDDRFNASVSNVPRLGIFGWQRTYVTVGLPLMYALPPDQFDAVLAHEFGHLSGSHPKHGLWVYRVGRTWQQLMDTLEEKKSLGGLLFHRFFTWFIPRLNAYGFVMSRADEYAADADAARVTSARAIGGALVALDLRHRALTEDLWPGIWARADREPAPPAEAWRTLPTGLREADSHEARAARVTNALREEAGDSNTHPSLRDRLRALGLLPDAGDGNTTVDDAAVSAADALVSPLERSAAAHYLGALAETELEALDTHWREQAARDWREQYAQGEARRARLGALTAKDSGPGLTTDELVELMRHTDAEHGVEAGAAVARRILAADDANPEAHFFLGRALLHADDASGVPHVRRAMDLDPDAIMPGARLLYAFHERRQERDAMAEMEARFNARRDALQEAQDERNQVREHDVFEDPRLDAAIVRAIQDGLRRTSLKSAVVTRKRTAHGQDHPLLVLIPATAWYRELWQDSDRNVAQELLDRITAPNLPDLLVLNPLNKRHRTLATSLRRDGRGTVVAR